MDSQKQQHSRRARKHHYLSSAYLAGFTTSGKNSDYLLVLDLEKCESRRGKPANVAYQCDLYTVDVFETPDEVEKSHAKQESDILPVIKHVCENKRFSNDELDQLLSFISLTSARLPSMRYYMKAYVEKQTGKPFEEALLDQGAWQWLSECSGKPLDHVFADIKQSMSDKSQLWHVLSIAPVHVMLLNILREKVWSLCIASQDCKLVCTDNPIGAAFPLDYASDASPAFGNPATILTFPLDRHAALVSGVYKSPCIAHVTDSAIAEINTRTLQRANRFVFAPSTDFSFFLRDGTIQKGDSIFELIKSDSAVNRRMIK